MYWWWLLKTWLAMSATLSATTTFLKKPQQIRKTPASNCPASMARGFWTWGRNVWARSMGPATSWGKKDT